MAETARRTDPKLWEKVKERVTRGNKGGKPGQWSARKAQLATSEYKKKGGGYIGKKSADNHLVQWTDEDWGTKSGKSSGKTGERYLPRKTREALSDREYAQTTQKKRADTRRGKQFSAQPQPVAVKAALTRKTAQDRRRKTAGEGTVRAASAGKRQASGGRTRSVRASASEARTKSTKAEKTSHITSADGQNRLPARAKRATAARAGARKAADGGKQKP